MNTWNSHGEKIEIRSHAREQEGSNDVVGDAESAECLHEDSKLLIFDPWFCGR